jgi:SAM-dependent methyltransferase
LRAVTDLTEHYTSGIAARLEGILEELSPGGGRVTTEQLSGFDHFHTAGKAATVRNADLLQPAAEDLVLDAGCGLGGPARYLAERFGCRVVGVDLTPDFIEAAEVLNARTGMSDRVEVRVGDITALDMADESVDHVWTQHVAMNIADREGLYAEIRRVMRPGGRFLLYDVVDAGGGELLLPVPWASSAELSHLVTRDELRGLLSGAGFAIERWEDPTEEVVEQTRAMLGAAAQGGEQPTLTTALFIRDAKRALPTYFRNMEEGRTGIALALCTAE